jgi:hypothetical protein
MKKLPKILASGCWILVTGFWLLVTGDWQLVFRVLRVGLFE